MAQKRLVIIDGYSLLFRAFYGTRYLSTSSGRPTNALFGFINMLFTFFQSIEPDAVVVALDAPGKTFRHAEYPEYKGTRRETPPELIEQLEASRDLISAFKLPVLELTGYEADDIIGTISRLAEENGYDTTIVTGDLDALQLVDDAVSVLAPQSFGKPPRTYKPEDVHDRYGFGPEHVVDYKAMAGDSSDNIPGVPGVGDKTATLLIKRFGSIERILENLEEMEPKYRKKIEPNEEVMKLSKWLATIDRNVPIEYDFAPYRLDADDLEDIRKMLLSLEFKTQVKRLEGVLAAYIEGGSAEPKAEVVRESIQVRFDETPASYEELQGWVGKRNFAIYIHHEEHDQGSMFEEDGDEFAYLEIDREVRRAAKADAARILADHSGQVAGHDLKPLFNLAGRSLQAPQFDTLLAGYVLQSDRSGYDLSDLFSGYLDEDPSAKPQIRAAAISMLADEMRAKLEKEGQTAVLNDIELPLLPILSDMELEGICLDSGVLSEFSKELAVKIEGIQAKIYELAGEEFNVGSPKQIGEILFGKMEIPGGKKTKTGWATGAEILEDLADNHEIAGEILNYREVAKLKSTYADALSKLIAEDGRVHTTFNQAVAATGRLSSNDPNLQNIPIRTDLGRRIREAFVAPKGRELLSFDYSQVELRILAHMCCDSALVEAFKNDEDIHLTSAALMFHVRPEDVTREQRGQAKLLNFAVLYGVTDHGLARQLGKEFSRADARELIDQYSERFPAVKEFTDSIVAGARKTGFTTTLFGRRRHFAEIHSQNFNRRSYSERQAMNAPIQGTAADMIKLAMIKIRPLLESGETQMLLQVHDELVFEVPKGDDSMIEPIRSAMESALPLSVPVKVDAKRGPNWLKLKPI